MNKKSNKKRNFLIKLNRPKLLRKKTKKDFCKILSKSKIPSNKIK